MYELVTANVGIVVAVSHIKDGQRIPCRAWLA